MRMLTKSRLVIVAVAVAMGLSLLNSANAQDPVKRGDLGTGLVFSVLKGLKPQLGDKLETGIYEPKTDSTKELGLPKGQKYTMLKIDGKGGAQALVQWSTDAPALQDILGSKQSVISGVSKDLELRVGDKAKLQAQRDGDKVDFTFEFFRDKKVIGTLSFKVDSKKK